MNGLGTIVLLTLREAQRRRIVFATLLTVLGFILVFSLGLYSIHSFSGYMPLMMHRIQLRLLATMGFHVANFLLAAIVVLVSADTLSGEIASGVMQTLASKPINRAAIVLGKWIAYAVIIGAFVTLIVGGMGLANRLITGSSLPHLPEVAALMWLECVVLLSLSLAGGARVSTAANGIIVFAFYGIAFIGGWIEQIGTMIGNERSKHIGIVISLLSPTDAIWRLGAYRIQPVAAPMNNPFMVASVPSGLMVIWAIVFIAVVLALAVRGFQRRAL